ncbi:MAG: hypothetical protein P1P77_06320, partial [Spirochaetaceae bacterium]|nr:hypothetical protein [Spirochaetaceae bacterium]
MFDGSPFKDLFGVLAAARYEGNVRNTGDPHRHVDVGQETLEIRERPKFQGAGRESEGPIVPERPVKTGGGKGPCGDKACEGGPCKGMSEKTNNPEDKVR